MPYDDLYEKHGNRVGIDPKILKRFAQIENSERAEGCTGSYCGLFQLSQREFNRWGGTGSRFDPEQNTMAAANKLSNESAQFRDKYGRDPTGAELYLIHNQGWGGAQAHLDNPDAPAWQNMYSTGEGREKGAGWSKLAIRLNVPGGVGQYGGVENVTSQQFIDSWNRKFDTVQMAQHESAGLPQQAEDIEEHETAGLPGDIGGEITEDGQKRRVSGRGAADVAKKSLINEDDEPLIPEIKTRPAQLETPSLVNRAFQ